MNGNTHPWNICFSREEAAKYLDISVYKLKKHLSVVPFYKFGKRTLYIKRDLDHVIDLGRALQNLKIEDDQS
ncbi:MAG: helix-turn-helix domain-containing protein [Puniceicoccales bacterium]|jgi:hypothetical protein|nr:helix-turn-helix domain-containing protein [Puniceicoccales bacterium]